jgi:hypothetical protein
MVARRRWKFFHFNNRRHRRRNGIEKRELREDEKGIQDLSGMNSYAIST